MFQIDGRDELFRWLGKEIDPRRRQGMLDWLAAFAADPLSEAHRVPGIAAPVYVAVVPLRPPVVIRFLFAAEFRTVKLLAFGPLP